MNNAPADKRLYEPGQSRLRIMLIFLFLYRKRFNANAFPDTYRSTIPVNPATIWQTKP